MVGEMVKKQGKLYHSCDYLCTLYFLVKIRKVKLKNLPTSACFNLNSGPKKQIQKCKGCKNGAIYRNL